MPTVAGSDAPGLVRVEKRGGLPVAATSAPGVLGSSDQIRFRISNEDPDYFGDEVVQAGLEFPAALPAVADHDHRIESSLGEWVNVERAGRETFATLRLVPRGESRLADLVRALHAGGFPLASSINFDIAPSDIEPVTRAGPDGRQQRGKRYRRGKVREISVTNFPANPAAIAVARSLGFNDAEVAALSRPEPTPVSIARAITPVGGAPRRTTTVTLAEMIAAATAAHEAALATQATAITALETDSGEANMTAVSRATGEADALFARLTTLRNAETAATRRAAATPAPAPAAPTPVSRAVANVANPDNRSAAVNTRRTDTKDVPVGTRLAQLVIARSIAHETRRSQDVVAQELFGAEHELIAIARTAVGVADTTTAGWAQELVRQETQGLLQVELLPISAWAALAAQGITIPFNGAATVAIPQMDIGKQVGGAWVGEGGAIPLAKGTMSAKRLSRYKVGGIVPLTKELERTSSPAAVEVMRTFLRQVLSNLLDSSLIGNGPEVPGIKPAGLLFGVTPITGAAGGGQAAVQADLQAIMAAFNAANVRGRFVLLMSEMTITRLGMITNALGQVVFPEANAGRLGNAAIIASPFLADDVVIAVSVSHFASAFDPLETDISDSATVVLANADVTAPTHATGAGGIIGTAEQVPPDGGIPVSGAGAAAAAVGAQAISLWQTWSLGVRMVIPSSFGLTKAGAVQIVQGITW
jgi:HK97 family phage major capsid protein